MIEAPYIYVLTSMSKCLLKVSAATENFLAMNFCFRTTGLLIIIILGVE